MQGMPQAVRKCPYACTVLLGVPMPVQAAPRCAPQEDKTSCGNAPRAVLYSTVCQRLYECPRVVLRRQPALRAELPRCLYCTPHFTGTLTEMPPRLYCTPHSFEWTSRERGSYSRLEIWNNGPSASLYQGFPSEASLLFPKQ